MNKFLGSIIIITAALAIPAAAQHPSVIDVNYGNGNIVKETSGNGAPSDVCTGLLRYTQNDATAGQNIWQCVSGHMKQQGGTSSGGTAGLADPGAAGFVFRTTLNTTRKATYTDVQSLFAEDTTHNTAFTGTQATGGSDVLPTHIAGHAYLEYKAGTWQISYGTAASSQVARFSDLPGLTTKGDLGGYGTAPTRIPVGTDGQVLTADSTQSTGLKWAASSNGPNFATPRNPAVVLMQVNLARSRFDEIGAYSTPISGNPTDVVYSDDLGISVGSLSTGTTPSVTVGWSPGMVLAKNPSYQAIFGISSTTNVNVWLALCGNSCASSAGQIDPGANLGVSYVGFRYFSGTDTSWECYASEGGGVYTSTYAASGVAVDTATAHKFDVIWLDGTPRYYIDESPVCPDMTLTSLPADTIVLYPTAAWQSNTTTPVIGSLNKLYGGAD